MLRPPLAAISAVLAFGSPVAAQAPAPPPIRAFDLRTVEALGREIWRQDVAAARASDALVKRVRDPGKAGIVGWLVSPPGGPERVRFLRRGSGGLEVAYEVEASAVREPASRMLSPEESAMFAAVQTAVAAAHPTCRPGYNTAVAKDPDGTGWLVWLLAPSPAAGAVPLGGHQRFTVSEDGRTVERRDALSASCLTVDPRQGLPKGAQPVGVIGSHVVSPTPVETHVFLQLLNRMPMYVVTGPRRWRIVDGRVAQMDTAPARR